MSKEKCCKNKCSEKKIQKTFNSLDKIVTWVVIGWAVASILWVTTTKKWRSFWKKILDEAQKTWKKTIAWGWRLLAWIIRLFSKKK